MCKSTVLQGKICNLISKVFAHFSDIFVFYTNFRRIYMIFVAMKRILKRDYFQMDIPEGRRVGNDLILLDADSYWVESDEPFIAAATTAIFVTKGTAQVSVNMKDYHVSAPCMIIYLEGMVVRQGALGPNARMDVFMVSKQLTDNILSESNIYSQLRSQIMRDPVFPIFGQGKVTAYFNRLLLKIVEMKDSPYRLEAAKHMILTLFYGFALSHPDRLNPKVQNRSENITERFFNLVKQNYKLHRDVAFYADELCITPKYLSQSVREATGKPALQMIDDFVIAESKALLRSTDMTVEQIAEAMGFHSQSLFGKYFKRVTGHSPRDYRKEAH